MHTRVTQIVNTSQILMDSMKRGEICSHYNEIEMCIRDRCYGTHSFCYWMPIISSDHCNDSQ